MVCSESVTGAPANAAKYPQVRTVAFHQGQGHGTKRPRGSRARRGLQIDGGIGLDVLFAIAAVVSDGASGEVDIVANDPGAPRCGQKLGVLFPAWSVRSAAISASRLKPGTSTVPDAKGAPTVTTGPYSVKNKLWHAGRNHRLRVTPAKRNVSARYGKPPTLGRIAIARWKAASKFSIALLMLLPLLANGFHHSPIIGSAQTVTTTRPRRTGCSTSSCACAISDRETRHQNFPRRPLHLVPSCPH
jgi:hypothetical protein